MLPAPKPQPPAAKGRRCELAFPRATAFLNFLLTCAEEPALAPGSDLYDQCLNRVVVARGSQAVSVVARGPTPLVKLMEQMAVANGGEVRPHQKADAAPQTITVDHLLRSVRLRPGKAEGSAAVLLALWGATGEGLTECVRHLWDLSAGAVELAFVQAGGEQFPTHLIRVSGLRHPDALQAWVQGEGGRVEAYEPVEADRQPPRFYTRVGFEYPVPGLERLCGLDSELVLIRPREGNAAPQWLAFAAGQVNFFRKPHEVFEVETTADPAALAELKEGDPGPAVPLEVAVVPQPRPRANQVWLIDGEIDRQRHTLQDLERQRVRLTTGEADEVYFAYRFDQDGTDRLNPLLARLMQQRLGTLAYYDYAFCQPAKGPGYHLLLANRTRRQLGFSVQPADKVFYQPAQWRRWGVNLYLPAGSELCPRVDGADSVPLLQRLLDKAGAAGPEGRTLADYPAVLWEPATEGRIRETRVARTTPLLDQYRLLNSFQRSVAGEVAAATRKAMADGMAAARGDVAAALDALEADVVDYFTKRTGEMEQRFTGMEAQLKSAADLVGKIEPGAAKVSKLVLNLPGEWVGFVDRVVTTHREIADPTLRAQIKIAGIGRKSVADLRAVAARGRDLVAAAKATRDKLTTQLADCDKEVREGANARREVDDLAVRLVALLREVAAVHARLADRVRRTEADEQKAAKMQADIDQIEGREKAAKERLESLKEVHAKAEKATAAVAALEADANAREEKLLARGRELAVQRGDLQRRIEQSMDRLLAVERDLTTVAARTGEVDQVFAALSEEAEMIAAHADAVKLWENQQQLWTGHTRGQREELTAAIDGLGRTIADAERRDERVTRAERLVNEATALLQTLD